MKLKVSSAFSAVHYLLRGKCTCIDDGGGGGGEQWGLLWISRIPFRLNIPRQFLDRTLWDKKISLGRVKLSVKVMIEE